MPPKPIHDCKLHHAVLELTDVPFLDLAVDKLGIRLEGRLQILFDCDPGGGRHRLRFCFWGWQRFGVDDSGLG
jgi:hypothetical protein